MTELLVRVECDCGVVAGIIEGGIFPLCPQCGRRMVVPEDRTKALAWIADLVPEGEAVRALPPGDGRTIARRYDDADLAAKRKACNMPTEPQTWPTVGSPCGWSVVVPPWETAA